MILRGRVLLLRVNSGPSVSAPGESAARGRADGTRRKRTIARRTSGARGIAVAAGGEPDSLLLARTGHTPVIIFLSKPPTFHRETSRRFCPPDQGENSPVVGSEDLLLCGYSEVRRL